jgi:hypothetical protein
MSQKEVAIVGHNNTRAQVTGQEELLVKVNSIGSTTGLATEVTLQQVEVNTSPYARVPSMIRTSLSGALTPNIYSASVANVGTLDGLFLGAILKSGEIINISAGDINNYFASNVITYNAIGTEFIITYITAV